VAPATCCRCCEAIRENRHRLFWVLFVELNPRSTKRKKERKAEKLTGHTSVRRGMVKCFFDPIWKLGFLWIGTKNMLKQKEIVTFTEKAKAGRLYTENVNGAV
jgi:hypothetical protein